MRLDRFRVVLDCLSSVAMIAAAGSVIWIYNFRPVTSAATPTAKSGVEKTSDLFVTIDRSAPVEGAGRVAVLEFSDFQCPFCGRYATQVYSQVRRDYVDNRRIMYVFRNLPLETIHPFALGAAQAAACAQEQGQFWAMHDSLFQDQHALARVDLVRRANELRLDPTTFTRCMDRGQLADQIRTDRSDAERLGVRVTPTLLVGIASPKGDISIKRRISGSVTYSVVKSAIDDVLAEAEKTRTP